MVNSLVSGKLGEGVDVFSGEGTLVGCLLTFCELDRSLGLDPGLD